EVPQQTVRVDEMQHRRTAEIEFMRNLPNDPSARQAKLHYLKTLFSRTTSSEDRSYRDFSAGIYLINSAARVLTDDQVAQVRNMLKGGKCDAKNPAVPVRRVVQDISVQERMALWDDVLAFNTTLPPDGLKQEYILAWLEYYSQHQRMRLYQFLAGELKENGQDVSLPADPRERAEVLDYLDTWGLDTRQIGEHKGASHCYVWYHLTDPPARW